MSKDRRLGKGLAALLRMEDEELTSADPAAVVDEADLADAGEPRELPVDAIEPNPFQPRREFNETEIASLAESLRRHEMLVPLLVRQVGDRYELIAGERRLRAAIVAGFAILPVRLREADDQMVAELAIIENIHRKDLNPIEKALCFRRYLREYQCTQEDLAQWLKIDRSTIANLIRLLELPEPVLNAVRDDLISAGHARALLPLGDERSQIAYAEKIQREGLSVRATERGVQAQIEAEDGPGQRRSRRRSQASRSPQVVSLEQELKRALGTKVEIQSGARHRGKIVIHFNGHPEFDRLWELLLGDPSRARAA